MRAIASPCEDSLVGMLVEAGVSKEDAEVHSEAIRRGGTLVTVRTEDSPASTLDAILTRHKPIDALARRKEYSTAGWNGYDPAAEPYDLSEAERERIRASYRVM